MQALGQALQHNNSLKTIDLSYNSTGALGVHALAEACRHSRGLVVLQLAHNSLADAAAMPLAQLLSDDSCSIKKLNLANNGLSDQWACVAARALGSGTVTLRNLTLSGNSICSRGRFFEPELLLLVPDFVCCRGCCAWCRDCWAPSCFRAVAG